MPGRRLLPIILGKFLGWTDAPALAGGAKESRTKVRRLLENAIFPGAMSMPPVTQTSNPSLGQPLGGTHGDLRYRFLHFHIPLALVSVIVLFLWMSLPLFQAGGHQGPPQAAQATSHQGPPTSGTPSTMHQGESHQGPLQSDGAMPPMNHSGDQTENPNRTQNRLLIARFTTATGYIGLGLLGLTLIIGPANLLLRRRTPISTYLARDVGMWAAIMSMVHVIAGFFVHGPPAPLSARIIYYFFAPDGRPLTNTFGWGNWTGLAATVIVVGLFTISNDYALRKLKARNWKNLQRLNYILFLLVIAHAIFYGVLRVTSIPTLLFAFIVILVLIGQTVGIWLWQRKHSGNGSIFPP
jgi:methionine sulfoxide reductase heme-binding subunit